MKTLAFLLVATLSVIASADTVQLGLTTTRVHYTIDEPIELSVLYTNQGGNAKSVPVEIRASDGAVVTLSVPVDAASGQSQARLVTIRANALKPTSYVASSSVGGEPSKIEFAVHNSEHINPYFTGQWQHHAETPANAIAKSGWMYMNTDYASLPPRTPKVGDLADGYVAAGSKPYSRMVLGGGHQLDLDLVNDWGDPWVQRAVVWRMQLDALTNRIYPIAGLHCYDEPGLTWWPTKDQDGAKGDANPFVIPNQVEEFAKLTGKQMPTGPFALTGTKYAGMMDDWLAFMSMRMKYLGQAWFATMYGTNSVEPKFATLNQVSTSYAPGDITDGVDSRENIPYDVLSGHGGYSDLPFGTMQPARSAEGYWGMAWDKRHVYLPMWYTHSWATMRNAVFLSWTTKLDGILYTPETDFLMDNGTFGFNGTNTILEVAEINRRLAMVGGVMNQLKKTLSPIAVLTSDRQAAADVATTNAKEIYKNGPPQYVSEHRDAVSAEFFRVMETGIVPNWLDEFEATEKGADFLKQWKIIFCPRLSTVTDKFRAALEGFVKGGGKLIQWEGDKLIIPGSIIAKHAVGDATARYMNEIDKKPDAEAISKSNDLSWRKWNMETAPTFAADLAGWLGEQPYKVADTNVIIGVHKAGAATYLLMCNNLQDPANPRGIKHELIPIATSVKISGDGVVYDLFNGGKVSVDNGAAPLNLPAGDGACWVQLPADPGKPTVAAKIDKDNLLQVDVKWGTVGYLPFRLRVVDPSGNKVLDLYRSTAPIEGATTFSHAYPLGSNAAAGEWKVEVFEWMNGSTTTASAQVGNAEQSQLASAQSDNVSIYFDDAKRIGDLLSGHASEPPYEKMNWDAKRVFGLNPKKFAIFGPSDSAQKLATALQGKGMTVDVNPAYEIKPFVREANRGGAGPLFREANFENIYAHAIVLPGHKLAEMSTNRGHINRLVTATFPGPGRAYIQWGSSCYQAGWQNVFVFGDTNVGVEWLLASINGNAPQKNLVAVQSNAKVGGDVASALPKLIVASSIKTADVPVGVGASPDGKTTYVALFDGSVSAIDSSGKTIWHTPNALLEAWTLAVSPKGDRVSVAGYPGVLVLDRTSGKVLGGFRAPPATMLGWALTNQIVDVAWNSAGTLVAAGWMNNTAKKDPHDAVILDAQGNVKRTLKDVVGNVYGVAFVPNTDTLLLGADKLTAVNATSGAILWSNEIKNARRFAFAADGSSAAAGGWGKNAGVFNLSDGKVSTLAPFDSVVGGVALTPSGDLICAIWGGVHPLQLVKGAAKKGETFFVSSFGFQDVSWSPTKNALIACEQGGRIWTLSPDGKPQSMLDTDAGTTAYKMTQTATGELLLGRMNRVVQRVTLK